MTCQPLRSLEGVTVSRGLRQLDNIIDALWVVIIQKSLAEGAAEGRLSQNTIFDGLEAHDLNPQPDRGGSLHVCVGDDSLTSLLSLLSTRILCRHVSNLPCDDGILSTRGIMSKKQATVIVHRWDRNDLLTEQRPGISTVFTTTHTDGVVHSTAAASFGQARCLCDRRVQQHVQDPFRDLTYTSSVVAPSIGKIEHRGHFDDQFHHVPNQGFVMIHHNHTSRSVQNRQIFAVECAV